MATEGTGDPECSTADAISGRLQLGCKMLTAAVAAEGGPSGCQPRRAARRASGFAASPEHYSARPNGAKRVRAKGLRPTPSPAVSLDEMVGLLRTPGAGFVL